MLETTATPQTAEQELASAFLSGVEDQPSIQIEATPEETASSEAQSARVEEQPVAPASPSDWQPREFTFKRNGEEVKYKPSSPEEEIELVRKGYDYTQKTMEVADERKKLQAIAQELFQREQARQESIRAFFADKAKLRRYVELLDAQGGAPGAPASSGAPASDDDELEPISRADLAKLRQELIAEAEQKADVRAKAQVEHFMEEASRSHLEVEYRSDFDKTIESLLTRFPVLADVEDVDELIRRDGWKAFQSQVTLNPHAAVDPAHVKNAMLESAQRRADRLQKRNREREKIDAVERATLTTRGPEPPGGNAPLAPPTPKKLGLKDPDLDAQVVAEIAALMRA